MRDVLFGWLAPVCGDFHFKDFFKCFAGGVCIWAFVDLDDPGGVFAGAVGGVHAKIVESCGGGDGEVRWPREGACDAVSDDFTLVAAEEDADGGGFFCLK